LSRVSLGARIDAWIDGWTAQHGGWRPPLQFLALFVLTWTTFNIVSQASVGLHMDVVEVYDWSRHLSAGYSKHPPLNALIAWTWLRFFPASDWSMHLMAMVVAAGALFGADLVARRYLTGDKRLIALVLLMLTPFYQFHADNFSTNQAMLLTWPIATFGFLRAFERRTIGSSIFAGVAAGAAMLAKYYSIYLIASFAVAVAVHPARWRYLGSWSPCLSTIAGLAVMAPNLFWLKTNGLQPLHYAYQVHAAPSLWAILGADLRYLAEAPAYMALGLIAFWVVVRPGRTTLAGALWPRAPQILLPPISAPFLGFIPTPLWTMQSWFLLPILLLSFEEVQMPRPATKRLLMLLAALTGGTLLVSPAVAVARHLHPDRRAYYRGAAQMLTQLWRESTGRPVTIVRGDPEMAYAIGYYSPDHPDPAPASGVNVAAPWVTASRLAHEGSAQICIEGDAWYPPEQCRREARPGTRVVDFMLANQFLWLAGQPRRFSILITPPRR